MVSGDYQCYATLAHDRGTDPSCRLCNRPSSSPSPTEDLVHLLTRCKGTADTRHRIMPELLNMLATYYPENRLLTQPAHDTLTQFLLDCSSLNLPSDIRLSPRQPDFKIVAKQCRNMIYAIHKERLRQLGALGLLSTHSSV